MLSMSLKILGRNTKLILPRYLIDQEQQTSGGEAFNEAVEQRLGLRVDPVQVLADQQQGLHLAFAQQHALERGQRALAALRRIEPQERAVLGQRVQQGEQGRQGLLQRVVEG